MSRIVTSGFAVCFLLCATMVSAGTIYTWIDADGVKRYSNSQPPEGAQHVRRIDEIPYDQGHEDSNRQAFDRMVDDASKQADRHFKEQDEKKAREAIEEKARQQQAQSDRLATQRAELQREIDAIQNRALGPTFTGGMKENQIKQLQDQIDRLEIGNQ